MALKKHPSDSAECRGAKRKHVTLNILQKKKILPELNEVELLHNLREYYYVNTTKFDMKNQREKRSNFYTKSDLNKGIAKGL